MLTVEVAYQWDGVTFALNPVSRLQLEARFPEGHRASRVFVGTHEAHPQHVRAIGPHDGDPDGRLKIVVEMLAGVGLEHVVPVQFHDYQLDGPPHRIEGN